MLSAKTSVLNLQIESFSFKRRLLNDTCMIHSRCILERDS